MMVSASAGGLALLDLSRLTLEGRRRALNPAILVGLSGMALAGLFVWRMGRFEVPVLGQLSSIDPGTTAVVVLLFTFALSAVIVVALRYVRSIEPLASLDNG